jgi:HEPN domain-containing protein
MKTSESNPADWYRLAEDRLSAADAIYAQSGMTYAGIELLHEAFERYLKGYLISMGWTLRRTHDLSDLLSAAVQFDPAFSAYAGIADNLTDQFWAQHYPGGDLSEVGTDYPEVRDGVGKLVELIAGRH